MPYAGRAARPATRPIVRRVGGVVDAPPRRRAVAAVLGLAAAGLPVAGLLTVRPAFAHHGYLGKHDFARPMYLAGQVTQAYIGEPHGRLTLTVTRDLRLPRTLDSLRAIEDVERRPTLSILTPAPYRGSVTVVLDGATSRILMDQPERLQVGDRVEAIVYLRTSSDEYRNELRTALLVLADGRALVSSNAGVGSNPSALR